MKALLMTGILLMASMAFASGDMNPSETLSEEEAVEVGDVKTSTCSAHVSMGETSDVEVDSGTSKESIKTNSSRQ